MLSKCRKLTGLTLFALVIIDDEIKRRMEATMEGIYLETAVQVMAIAGGLAGLVLAALQAAETWLDVRGKLKKRQRIRRKSRQN